MDTFIECLVYYMEKRGLNPTSLAKKAGLNQTAIRDIIESRSQNPRLDTFLKLCQALSLRPHQLYPGLSDLYTDDQVKVLKELDAIAEQRAALEARAAELMKKT